ncbi:MAG: hypothetical protein LBR83_08360 [Clostridiales bacterium]|jgi:signal transduction histidine kinase|nr:hypothetical protein [Clostridiales bacterium]
MAAFYQWPRAVCYLFTFILALCVLFQTATMAACFYQYDKKRNRFPKTLLELFILVHILYCALIHGRAMHGYETGILVTAGYDILRADIFAFLYVAVVLFWLIRSVASVFSRYKKIKSRISAMSVKNAIDALSTGILFCEENGFAVLANRQMQRLMVAFTGKIHRNGKQFYNQLMSGETKPGQGFVKFEGRNVSLLPDGSAWMFTVSELRIKGKTYYQLTATDITERWKLTSELNAQNEELMKRRAELNGEIANVHALSRERERQRAKMRAHDILGARLTFMLRAVQSNQPLDCAKLKDMSRRLPDDLAAARQDPSPRDRIDALTQAFASIGVEVIWDGDLPEKDSAGQFAADVAREAVTNAVRHGFATRVNIHMDSTDGFKMKVTDNGRPPAGKITEGGGISGLREKVKRCNGTVEVVFSPQFVLSVYLPGNL